MTRYVLQFGNDQEAHDIIKGNVVRSVREVEVPRSLMTLLYGKEKRRILTIIRKAQTASWQLNLRDGAMGITASTKATLLFRQSASTTPRPPGLPTITYKGKKYFVDFRSEELRDVNTATPLKFYNIPGGVDSQIKKKLRALRFRTSSQSYIHGLDD